MSSHAGTAEVRCSPTMKRSSRYIRPIAFLDQAFVSGGNFLSGILMARAFGAYEFGAFTLGWLIVEFMSSLHFAAIIQPMLNIGVNEDDSRKREYYTAVAAQHIVFSGCAGLLVWGSVGFAGNLFPDFDLQRLAMPLGLATIAYQWHGFCRRYLFARERPVAALCNDVLRFCIQLSALLALPVLWAQPQSSAGIWIVAGACSVSAAQGVVLFGRLEWDSTAFCRILSRHWNFSKWLMSSAVMYWMTSQAFYVMSGFILGAATTGRLMAALAITLALNVILQALDSFAPAQAAAAMRRGGSAELRRYIERLALLIAVMMGAIVIIVNLEPESLIRLIYGEEYTGVGFMVPWLCAVGVLHGFNMVLCIWAAAMERTSFIFRAYTITTCFTVVLVYPLTAYGGVNGVLLGLVLVEVVKLIMLWISIKGVQNQRLE